MLPSLMYDCDYLIQNYATENDFFSNMNAVQNGFNDICLYNSFSSDTWIDGKYINKTEYFSPGAVLSDYPESNILITETEMPELIDYEREWNYATNSYVYSSANIVTTSINTI